MTGNVSIEQDASDVWKPSKKTRLCLKTISRRALAHGFPKKPAASAVRLISHPRFETQPILSLDASIEAVGECLG